MLTKFQKMHLQNLADHACIEAGVSLIPVRYGITGGVGGNFDPTPWVMNLNEQLVSENFEDFNNVIIHEVSHGVDYFRNKNKWRRTKKGKRTIHDKVFYAIMQELIDALKDEFPNLGVPSRLHPFETEHLKRRQRRWEYFCSIDCEYTGHKIATVTHNRIQKGQIRHCKHCNTNITFSGREIK